ncbi:MAG: ATP-binding cassette domain-containing protein [Oscillospiraceae bacterium]
MENVLTVKGLCKKYKHKTVLDHVDMTIRQGDIYGFVGKNGAGKTTLIRIISGLTDPSEGSFELFGAKSGSRDIDSARKKVCTMVESPAIYPDLNARDNLKMQCLITNKPYSCIDELLSFVDLADTGSKRARDFSLGMRQRLGIAIALVNEPQLMLLDEPINGLDPEGIKQVRELLLKMHSEKKVTILISSHILTELSLFATRYGFIDGGVIVKEATREEIQTETEESCCIESDNVIKAQEILDSLGYVTSPAEKGLRVKGDIDLMEVCSAFAEKHIRLTKHICNNIDLERYFMELIGGGNDESSEG